MWWWWVVACGDATPEDDCADDLVVDGAYAGEVTVGDASGNETSSLTFDLATTGAAVSGTAVVGQGAPFAVTGSLEACQLTLTGRLTTPCGTTNGGGARYCFDDWTFEAEVAPTGLGGDATLSTSNSEVEDDTSWTGTGSWQVEPTPGA